MILAILVSMGYAALNKKLSISGETFLRSHGNVRITGIKMNTTESDGNFTYNSEYSKRGTKVFSTLLNIDSNINYTVQINNTTGYKVRNRFSWGRNKSNFTQTEKIIDNTQSGYFCVMMYTNNYGNNYSYGMSISVKKIYLEK